MRAIYVLPGAVLAVALFGASASLASASTSDGDKCSVTVDRSGAPDSFSLSRQKLDAGGCVCYITTGPSPESDATEKKVSSVQASGSCGNYRDGIPVWLLSGAALGAGIAAAVSGNGHNDSPGG